MTRTDAQLLNRKFYIGKPCTRCGETKRRTTNGHCVNSQNHRREAAKGDANNRS